MTLSARLLRSLAGTALAATALWSCGARAPQAEPPDRSPMSLTEAMSPGVTDGFLRAKTPIDIVLPRDHGPHPGFQTEWWYLVGNLESSGRRFGYQVTFFRSALRPPRDTDEESAPSAWSTDDVFMAHFALTDVQTGSYRAFERFSRSALDLAGARTKPFAVWLDDWRLESLGDSGFPMRLRAEEEGVALDLVVESGKPAVLQGDLGLSQKGAQPGNASYYYSLTRLPTRGTVLLGELEIEVDGSSWMDREWSTSALEDGQVGWDWFALQLDDGRDLMVYRMRLAGDRTDPHSSGVIVEADGSYRRLEVDDFRIDVVDRWRSRETGAQYPSAWRLTSTVAGVELTVEPLLAAQEHTSSVIYWEGAVDVAGQSLGLPVSGRGYVELTGYERPDSTAKQPSQAVRDAS